jgi:phage gp29-like protein
MPLRLGKYDSGATPEDKDALAIAVQALGSDAAGIISKATEIEFVTSNIGSVSSDLYENLARFGNKEISKAILGSTLTADSDGKGSYALGNVHNDVRKDLIHADSMAIAATVRTQLIRPYVGFNYGWDTPVPKYTGRFKKEDMAAHAEMIDKFADRMDIPVSHIRKKYHIPEPQKGEETLRPKMGQFSARLENGPCYIAGAPNSSENRILDTTDLISGRLEDETDVHILAMLKTVKNIMADSGSLEEVREKLSGAFPKMDVSDLGELIAKAMTTANLVGKQEVMDNE